MISKNSNREIAKKAFEIIYGIDASPCEFSFGYVDSSGFCHDGLVIKKCAPVVIKKLVSSGFSLSMCADGLHVDNIPMHLSHEYDN